MSSLRAPIRWVVVLLLLCGLTTPGHAATSSAVEATDDACLREPTCSGHYQKALSLYESGRYEAALPEFQSAYESRQMPWLLINIGRTFHRLGRLDEAITLYKRYEQADPSGDPETLKKVREYKAQAEVLLASKSAPPAPPPDVVPAAGAVDKGRSPAPVPLYKKWWFWTAIGGGVAVIVVGGIAIGAATSNSRAPIPDGIPHYQPMF